jgi:hypothetical protein
VCLHCDGRDEAAVLVYSQSLSIDYDLLYSMDDAFINSGQTNHAGYLGLGDACLDPLLLLSPAPPPRCS